MRCVSGYMWRAALVLCASSLFGATAPVSITDRSTGIGVTFKRDGQYAISTGIAGWKFSGNLGQPPAAIAVREGSDSVAAYQVHRIGLTGLAGLERERGSWNQVTPRQNAAPNRSAG